MWPPEGSPMVAQELCHGQTALMCLVAEFGCIAPCTRNSTSTTRGDSIALLAVAQACAGGQDISTREIKSMLTSKQRCQDSCLSKRSAVQSDLSPCHACVTQHEYPALQHRCIMINAAHQPCTINMHTEDTTTTLKPANLRAWELHLGDDLRQL